MPYQYKALVVEDEKLILNNLVKKIERSNLSIKVVAQACDGVTALAMQEEFLPDIIITDIRLPGISGLELIEQVKERYPDTKFIIISGYSEFTHAQKALQLQVIDYLLKPVKENELYNSLAKLILSLQNHDISLHLDGQKDKVNLVKLYIQKNYDKNININTIAQNFGYTPSHLSRLFMKSEKVNISKYLSIIRINHAKQLLCDKNILIKQVGEQVGYPDPYHFSKIFKLATGKTPMEYRESMLLITDAD